MINTPAKILLSLAAFSGVTAVVYGVASGDRSGGVLLAAVMVAALFVSFAVMGSAGADPLDAPEDDEAAAAAVSYGPGDAARPSPWPLMTALAAGLVAVGAAEGPAFVVGGVVLALVVAGGWTAQVWTEHPAWTPRLGARLGQRVMVPGLLPVVALLTTALIAISLSRVLLAVSKDGSVVVAMVAALVILISCAVVAYRPRLGPGALVGLVVVGAVIAGTAGIFGAAAGERTIHPEGAEGPGFKIVARNTAFDKKRIVVPAAKTVRVDFANDDTIFHNFAVYTTDGKPVFAGRPVNHREEVLEMKIPAPGTYTFVCDFHPSMKGDLVAE
jgi:plastocyanin